MSDTETGAPPALENGAGDLTGPGIRVLAQFTRDLSFENPRAPESLRAAGEAPQIDIGPPHACLLYTSPSPRD
ncbi:MAG: hypothetical protein EBS42_09805, partial [Caulobacteraceae bacterium]|nr:hypothetical protein [Caulobacteraceae bacterium]